ncbi:hypothetical protein XH79_07475 [Bradyrhizobium sp. CCBAU 45389]|nr:hypothetical protein [Bradyrhizobium sp. CCBAU 45389]
MTQQIASLPPSEDTMSAVKFLKRSDLAQPATLTGTSDNAPAEFWLRLRRRQESTIRAGIATRGFPSLLAALEKA